MNPRPPKRSRAVPVAVVVAAVLLLALFTTGASGPSARFVPPVIGGGAVAAALWAVVRRRAERAEYEQRLTVWAASEAVVAERLEIARDLHDLVSHGLGLITVRAAATRHLPQSPEIREAFADIEEAGREATDELRRMLAVLRDPASDAPRTPAESLAALAGIVHGYRVAGMRPDLVFEPVGPVAASIQVAVCRTVREGLSNAARHAGPTPVRVSVHRDGGFVVVSVADHGPAPGWHATPGAGHGLAGLRERVGSLDGTVSAGPVDGGFRLTARIPA